MHYGSMFHCSITGIDPLTEQRYNLDASETFLQNLIHHCYTSPIADLRPRRLALLLMVLSIGSLVDLNRPLGSLYGEAYHHLARASICEIPLMEEPDFDVLHGLVSSFPPARVQILILVLYHLVLHAVVGYPPHSCEIEIRSTPTGIILSFQTITKLLGTHGTSWDLSASLQSFAPIACSHPPAKLAQGVSNTPLFLISQAIVM